MAYELRAVRFLNKGTTGRGGRRETILEDVDGSFARFLRELPGDARVHLSHAIRITTYAIAGRMRETVKRIAYLTGDMHNKIENRPPKQTALVGRAGIWDTVEAEIALYNEYTPNRQPFMRPSVDDEQRQYVKRVQAAMRLTDRYYGPGGRTI